MYQKYATRAVCCKCGKRTEAGYTNLVTKETFCIECTKAILFPAVDRSKYEWETPRRDMWY